LFFVFIWIYIYINIFTIALDLQTKAYDGKLEYTRTISMLENWIYGNKLVCAQIGIDQGSW